MRIFAFVLFALNLVGCTYALHLSEVDDVQATIRDKNATRIKAQTEQFSVMGFVTQTDYVNEAWAKLQHQCPDGEITGVNTRFSTAHGFFSWTNRIKMTGWCVAKAKG